MGNVSQDRVAMGQAADRCEQALTTIDSVRDGILRSRDELRATWAGNTAVTFDSVINSYDTKLKKILDTLNGLIEKLGKTKINYEQTEDNSNSAVTKFDALLDGTT